MTHDKWTKVSFYFYIFNVLLDKYDSIIKTHYHAVMLYCIMSFYNKKKLTQENEIRSQADTGKDLHPLLFRSLLDLQRAVLRLYL